MCRKACWSQGRIARGLKHVPQRLASIHPLTSPPPSPAPFRPNRLINVLSRRTKNNPVVLGDPGVGKTALIDGLALRIAAGDVPDALRE